MQCHCDKFELKLNLILAIFVILIILHIFYYIAIGNAKMEKIQSWQADWIGNQLPKNLGKPLSETIYTSGADLRDYGQVFSSTDQGAEMLKSKMY